LRGADPARAQSGTPPHRPAYPDPQRLQPVSAAAV
jgi:hypothetical protein